MKQELLFSESCAKIENKYERGNHIVGVSMWEFEWTPKYRYNMFRKWKYKKLVEGCIRRAASEHKIEWIELNCSAGPYSGHGADSNDDDTVDGLATFEGEVCVFVFSSAPESKIEISERASLESRKVCSVAGIYTG